MADPITRKARAVILAACVALVALTGTACETTHPNGCVEWVGPDAGDLDYQRVTAPRHRTWDRTAPPAPVAAPMGAWVHKTTGQVHLWSQQEDSRRWRTRNCAATMPAY